MTACSRGTCAQRFSNRGTASVKHDLQFFTRSARRDVWLPHDVLCCTKRFLCADPSIDTAALAGAVARRAFAQFAGASVGGCRQDSPALRHCDNDAGFLRLCGTTLRRPSRSRPAGDRIEPERLFPACSSARTLAVASILIKLSPAAIVPSTLVHRSTRRELQPPADAARRRIEAALQISSRSGLYCRCPLRADGQMVGKAAIRAEGRLFGDG